MYTAVIYYVDTSSINITPPCQIDKQNRVCFVFLKTLNLSRFPAFSQLCKENPTLSSFSALISIVFFLELVAARQEEIFLVFSSPRALILKCIFALDT